MQFVEKGFFYQLDALPMPNQQCQNNRGQYTIIIQLGVFVKSNLLC